MIARLKKKDECVPDQKGSRTQKKRKRQKKDNPFRQVHLARKGRKAVLFFKQDVPLYSEIYFRKSTYQILKYI